MAPHAHEFSINLEKNERKKKITSVHLSSSIEITSYSKVLKLPEISLHTNQKEISHRPLVHIYIYIYIFRLLSSAVWHQKEGGEGSRGSGCDGAGLRGQPDPSEEGGSHWLWRRGGRGEHRGYGHEVHPDSAHGYVQ